MIDDFIDELDGPSRTPPVGPIERVVLLGFMTSGKSSVGQALARRLEWRFVDFDVEIERREGRSVPEIASDEGEPALREREAAITHELVGERRIVLAPGGAWITRPALLDALGPGTLAVLLRVSAEETARRLKQDSIARPFRDLDDPLPRIRRMLDVREPLYRLADLSVPTDGRPVEAIAHEVETVVRLRGVCGPDGG